LRELRRLVAPMHEPKLVRISGISTVTQRLAGATRAPRPPTKVDGGVGGTTGLAHPVVYQMGSANRLTQGGALAVIVCSIAGFLIGSQIKKP